MRAVIAATVSAVLLMSHAPAFAGSQELVEYTRQLLAAGELPKIADDADLQLVSDGKATKLTAAQLRAGHEKATHLIKELKLKEFKVEHVDCGQKLCFIRYTQAVQARIGNKDMIAAASSEEVYLQSGTDFILVRAYQVQHTEGEL